MHRFCERRLLDRHVARIAAEYRRRRDTLVASLKRRMPEDVTWTEPEGGFSLLVTLPAGLDAGALLARAHERGVAYTPGAAFWVDGSGERTLRLSFSSVPGGKIDEGVRRLGAVERRSGVNSRARRPTVERRSGVNSRARRPTVERRSGVNSRARRPTVERRSGVNSRARRPTVERRSPAKALRRQI
ncbi:MAG: hypothetical protein DMD84_08865 [Candidatus Rokuibacteriota bacterium]|nr:MAG: hypothetical protein DMD84_08865 [Candidatus Rokubacteria bacterium]